MHLYSRRSLRPIPALRSILSTLATFATLVTFSGLFSFAAQAEPSPYAKLDGTWKVSPARGASEYTLKLTQVAHPSETDNSRLYNLSFDEDDSAPPSDNGWQAIWVMFGQNERGEFTAYWQHYKDTSNPSLGSGNSPRTNPVRGKDELVSIDAQGALVFRDAKGAELRRMTRVR